MKRLTIIHHSATGLNVSDATIKSWPFYNLVIKPDGTIIYLKEKLNYRKDDKYSYDIVLIGNFEVEGSFPTQAQINSLQAILKRTTEPFLGHREINDFSLYDPATGKWPTACPGKNLMPYIVQWRTKPMNTKFIYVKNISGTDYIFSVLQEAKDWFKDKGEDIEFSSADSLNKWAEVYILPNPQNDYATGGCGSTKPYKITFLTGRLWTSVANKYSDILIHELLHAYYFDAGLGDLHDIKTAEKLNGLGGCYDNEYNWKLWNYLKSKPEEGMLKLIKKELNSKDIYAVINNKRYWVADPTTFERGKDGIWKDWVSVTTEDPSKYLYAGQISIIKPDDPLLK